MGTPLQLHLRHLQPAPDTQLALLTHLQGPPDSKSEWTLNEWEGNTSDTCHYRSLSWHPTMLQREGRVDLPMAPPC